MKAMIITQCAWCREVKVSGGSATLALSALVHEIDLPAQNGKPIHYAVSHGICEPCKERMLVYSQAARASSLSYSSSR